MIVVLFQVKPLITKHYSNKGGKIKNTYLLNGIKSIKLKIKYHKK